MSTHDVFCRQKERTTSRGSTHEHLPYPHTKTDSSARTAASHGSSLDERTKSCPPPKRKRTGVSRECPYRLSQKRLTLELRTRAHPLPPYSKSVLAHHPFRLSRCGASARLRRALGSSSSLPPAAQARQRDYLGPQSHHLTPPPQHGVGCNLHCHEKSRTRTHTVRKPHTQ